MDDARVLLGVRDSASLEDIEEAYWNKKRLYNPEHFKEGSPEWRIARARNEALDKAYSEAVSALLAPRRAGFSFGRIIRAFPDRDLRKGDGVTPGAGSLAARLLIPPVASCLMQLLVPAVLFDLVPGGLRMSSLFPVALAVVLSYVFPLFLRFAVLKRPLESAVPTLLLFPTTLIATDFFASALLYFSFLLPGREFRYIPVFYVTGLGPLFLILCAHCAILRAPRGGRWRCVAPFGRLAVHTLVLLLSVALSLSVCAAGNREKGAAVAGVTPVSAAPSIGDMPGGPWQRLELLDVGAMEIPASWYVEDSNGQVRRVESGQVVLHVREALLARPYGQRDRGPNFAFEVLVYSWTRKNGRLLPPPEDALLRLQNRQFESLRRDYSDVTYVDRTRSEHEGHAVCSMTVETRSVPGYVIRFRNLILDRDDRLYCMLAGYPAGEEREWNLLLDDLLRRWQPQ